MPDSKSETALKALLAALVASKPAGVKVDRNRALPTKIPSAGLIILRDGDPGEPQIVMSPLSYDYEHAAEVDIIAVDDATYDVLKQAVGTAVAADRSLGGETFDLRARAPVAILIQDVTGAATTKASTIPVVMHYSTSDPLS